MTGLNVLLGALGLAGAAVAARALVAGGLHWARIPNRKVAGALLAGALTLPGIGFTLNRDDSDVEIRAGTTSTTVYRSAIAATDETTTTTQASTTTTTVAASTSSSSISTTTVQPTTTTTQAPETTTTTAASVTTATHLTPGYYDFSCSPAAVSFPMGGSAITACRVSWSEDFAGTIQVTCPESQITCEPKRTTLTVPPRGSSEVTLKVISTSAYPVSGGQLRVSADARAHGFHGRVAKVAVQVTPAPTTTTSTTTTSTTAATTTTPPDP